MLPLPLSVTVQCRRRPLLGPGAPTADLTAVDVVTVAGDLDLADADSLRCAALRHLSSCGAVVLDLGAVSFIDSAGVHALVSLRRRALLLGADLAIARPSHRTLRLLDLTGTLPLFETFPGLESARAELRRRRAQSLPQGMVRGEDRMGEQHAGHGAGMSSAGGTRHGGAAIDAEALLRAARQVVSAGLAEPPSHPGRTHPTTRPVDEELVRLEVEQLDEELRVVEEELARRRDESERLRDERSQASGLLARLLSSLPVAALTTDAAGAVRDANGAAGQLLRVHTLSLHRRPLVTFVHPDDRRRVRDALSALHRGEQRCDLGLRLMPRGATAPVPARAHLLALPDGRLGDVGAQWVLEPVSSERPAAVVQALLEVARLRRRSGSLREVLADLARLAAAAVPGADCASLLVGPTSAPQVLVTTGLPAQTLEGAQHRAGEGPGWDCRRREEPVPAGPDDAWRWPALAPLLPDLPRLLALPLAGTDEAAAAGSLTVLARSDADPEWPGREGRLVAQVFADAAAGLVRDTKEVEGLRALVGQLTEALSSRAVIEQAKGVVMATEGVDPDQAFGLLSRVSQETNVKLRVLAEQVVQRAAAGLGTENVVTGRPQRRRAGSRG